MKKFKILILYFYHMWTYYRDVTLYGAAICFLFGLASSPLRDSISSGVIITLIVFGVFGTGLGIAAFSYFQKQQYYMYYNLGFTKRELIFKTWSINLGVAIIFTIFLLPFL